MESSPRRPRSATALLRRVFLALLAVAALIWAAALGWAGPDGRTPPLLALAGGLVALGVAFLLVDRGLAAPLDRLARDLATVARDHPALALATPGWPWLRRLFVAVRAVQERLCAAENSLGDQLAAATARLEDQKPAWRRCCSICPRAWWSAAWTTGCCCTMRSPPTCSTSRTRSDLAGRCWVRCHARSSSTIWTGCCITIQLARRQPSVSSAPPPPPGTCGGRGWHC